MVRYKVEKMPQLGGNGGDGGCRRGGSLARGDLLVDGRSVAIGLHRDLVVERAKA